MSSRVLAKKSIAVLRDVSAVTPVEQADPGRWSIRSVSIERRDVPENYLSPHRQDFYKVMLIVKAHGVLTMGMRMYYIEEPTIVFIPPEEIVSWKGVTGKPDWNGEAEAAKEAGHCIAHHCLFKKEFVDRHPVLKAAMTRYRVFSDNSKQVIRLAENELEVVRPLFMQMQAAEAQGGIMAEDMMQAYLQLVFIESKKIGNYPPSTEVPEEYRHIHAFFALLKKETAAINYTDPVRIRTAKEFAESLTLTPNYLNALLKKHTGQNVSTHIKLRLLEESKALLLQTDWTLQDIGFSIGFSDQPNFSSFFKKLAGVTPAEYRKVHR